MQVRSKRKSVPLTFDPERNYELDLDDLKLINSIGSGIFSKVYEGMYQGQRVAVKKQKLVLAESSASGCEGERSNCDDDSSLFAAYLDKELSVLKTIAHPNLVKFVGASITNSTAYIAMEFMEGGDLRRLVLDSPQVAEALGWRSIVKIYADISSAVAYLHGRDLMHRDIKTQNIVLDANLRGVLCDLGFARQASHETQAMTICGTDEFMAPEIIFGMKYGLAADMYSLGVVGCELCCRKAPGRDGFLVRQPMHGFEVNMDEVRRSLYGSPPNSLVECIAQMCITDPDERLGAVDAEDWLEDLLKEIPMDKQSIYLDSSKSGIGTWMPSVNKSVASDRHKIDAAANSAAKTSSGEASTQMDESMGEKNDESMGEDIAPSSALISGIEIPGLIKYTEDDFIIDIDWLEFGAEIGKGQFSCVYEGVYLGRRVAVKKQRLEAKMIDRYLQQELSVLKNVQHPNLLHYVGANVKGNYLYVVTQYHHGGHLRHLLQLQDVSIGWHVMAKMLYDTSCALNHLHDMELIHRDVKTQNIVLGKELNVVLCDFGFARHTSRSQPAMTICGTDEFMAPEVIFGMEYGVAADQFSLGVVACEMITRKIPGKDGFIDRQPRNGFKVDMNSVREASSSDLPHALLKFAEKLCESEPDARPTASDAKLMLVEIMKDLTDEENKPIYIGGSQKWSNPVQSFRDSVLSPRSMRRPISLRNSVAERGREEPHALDKMNSSTMIQAQSLPLLSATGKGALEKATDNHEERQSTSKSGQVDIGVSDTRNTGAKLCNAPNCLTLNRDSSGFCSVHAPLRKYSFFIYASKRGLRMKTWRRRFFALQGTTLFYYKTMHSLCNGSTPQGTIQLLDKAILGQSCVDTAPSVKMTYGRENCARVHTHSRIYYIQFDSGEDRTSFIKAAMAAVAHASH